MLIDPRETCCIAECIADERTDEVATRPSDPKCVPRLCTRLPADKCCAMPAVACAVALAMLLPVASRPIAGPVSLGAVAVVGLVVVVAAPVVVGVGFVVVGKPVLAAVVPVALLVTVTGVPTSGPLSGMPVAGSIIVPEEPVGDVTRTPVTGAPFAPMTVPYVVELRIEPLTEVLG